jgi:hypothetical protein
MKKENRDCKIVQDLLPNYIENLTDEVTNEFIEEHIASCEECANILKNMNGEIKLEQINQDKEIKYLKNIRKRVIRTILLVTLIVTIIALGIVAYVYNKNKIEVNNYSFVIANYVSESQSGTVDGNVYGTLIAVIDENGICKSVRVEESGYTEEKIKSILEAMQINDTADNLKNPITGDFNWHYNINMWNGLTKEELKEQWSCYYKNITKIEDM